MNTKEATKLAEDHWVYVEKICHVMYVDVMVHGIKHGQAEKEPVGRKTHIDNKWYKRNELQHGTPYMDCITK